MTPASFELWLAAVAVVGSAGLGACGGSAATRGVTLPLISLPARVIATPRSASLGFGAPYRFHAVVDDGAGRRANLDSVADSVRVEPSVARSVPPCLAPYELDLAVHRAAGDTTVDRVALGSTSLPSEPLALTFHSDAKVGGVAQVPNGQYARRAVLLLNGGSAPAPSSTTNFTITNP